MTSVLSRGVPYHSLVVVIVLAIVISSNYCSVYGAVPPRSRVQDSKQDDLSPITLEEYLDGKFGARGFAGQWVEGSDNLIRIFRPEDIVDYNILDQSYSPILMIKEVIEKLGTQFSNIIFSSDMKYALLEHGRSSIWRYSTRAKYDIYDLSTKTLTKLVPPTASSSEDQKELQLVKWSPNGNGIAFVADYNIYYRPNAEPETPVIQITTDGSEENAIYNGIADWVYEEEMFGGPTALWISKNAENLAFVKFDDSKVQEFQWPIYGEPRSNTSIYPEYRAIRYPKAGFDNPQAHVYVVSLINPEEPKKLEYQETSEDERHLIGTALWATNDTLMVTTLNRVQTISHWHLCPKSTATCSQIHTYALEKGWVDMNTPKVSSDGTKFIFVRSVEQTNSNRSYYHIVMFGADESDHTVLTKGQLSVVDILGWDEKNHKIYFSGSFWNGTAADPSETQIYSVADNVPNADSQCITCGLRNKADQLCRENSATFSGNFTFFIHRCSGPDVPETTTRSTQNGESIDNPGPTFVGNTELREALEKKLVPITREYTIPTKDGFEAKARLYIPANYDANKKYPLLISVYGGPGSQNIKQGFGIGWEMTLVSNREIIFGHIDGRGTARQSTDHLFTLHKSLGTAEIEDQIIAAKWLMENEPLIDSNNTSIWGWSYGGYATAKVLETDTENVFKCGISVAPVTSWRYYDTIYTERYMGLPTPEDNLQGYNDSDVVGKEHVENLQNKMYMLVHGNADDNVHYQQSMILARSMEQNDIFFHQLSYPDENHGIAGPGMRRHLYHSLERFLFDECFKRSIQDPDPSTSTTQGGSSGSTTTNPEGSSASVIAINSILVATFSSIVMMARYAF